MSRAIRAGDGAVVADPCEIAGGFWARLRGWLGRADVEPGAGLWIVPARSVHMIGMRFSIDAVFLDESGRVLRIAEDLAPWRIAGCRDARSVLELAAGRTSAVGLAAGDLVVLADTDVKSALPLARTAP